MSKEFYHKNREKINTRRREMGFNRNRNPITVRKYELKKKYGLTIEDVDIMLKLQDNKCLLCGVEKKLQIDHCHDTGRVRGMLCIQCNVRLGWFENRAEKILEYIRWKNNNISSII